jgi:hypothetical protein
VNVSELGFSSPEAYLDAVVARVREAMAASGEPRHGASAAALLRRGREVIAWVRALRALTRKGAPGFREAEPLPERLWDTVEDGAAAPEARAAAAVALAPSLDAAERQKLHEVARVVVSPRLRVALEAAADDDDARVVEALAEIEAARLERR